MQIKKKIGIGIAIAAMIGLIFLLYDCHDRYEPSGDEIAIHVKLDTKEDIGLLIFDYCVDGRDYSGGTSNADGSMIRHDSDDYLVWNREELDSASEAVQLAVRFRIITEHVTPNYDNIYPEEITRYLDPINFDARFGEMYSVTITGDKTNGYQVVLNP